MLQYAYVYVAQAANAMRQDRHSYWQDIRSIILRHTVSLVTIVMGSVIVLLLWFGEARDALFLSSVLAINVITGIAQEIRARRILERLSELMPKVAKQVLPDGTLQEVSLQALQAGEVIQVQGGDQIPVDGVVRSEQGLEVNEAFLTGESISLAKNRASRVYAGSFVTAGSGVIRIKAIGQDTKLGTMTNQVKKHEWHSTPIQRALAGIISTLSYVLLIAVIGLTIRQRLIGGDAISLIKQIAAITGSLIPEGLILASTLLFAYGAIKLLRRQVLLQHIHSAEGLARLQILCLDKTGTLTESNVTLAEVRAAKNHTVSTVTSLATQYFAISDHTSSMSRALGIKSAATGEVVTSFSSDRRFGVVQTPTQRIAIGAVESICQHLSLALPANLHASSEELARSGKRVLLVVTMPKDSSMAQAQARIRGIIAFEQAVKHSAEPVLRFFKRRSVAIKIISGDHQSAVLSVAQQLQLSSDNQFDRVITGDELRKKSPHELISVVRDHALFARISPDQKAQLITACQTIGYTGMVGDGANDALAIKKADIGISMLDGAEITRSVADIVLMKNEFTDLPRGVRLADSIITTMELIGALFLNKVIVGLTLLTLAFITVEPYPFTPRNITVLNYFIIGLPILIWTLYPRNRKRTAFEPSYLRQIMPFVILNGMITSAATITAYLMAEIYFIDVQMTVFVSTLLLGMNLLFIAPRALGITHSPRYHRSVIWSCLIACGGLVLIFIITPLRSFFGLDPIRPDWLVLGIAIASAAITAQFFSLRYLFLSKVHRWLNAGHLS